MSSPLSLPPGDVIPPIAAAALQLPQQQCDFDTVKLSDIEEDESGNAKGVYGQLWSQLSSKQLRTVCSRLVAIKGAKNAKKAGMEDILIKWYFNRKNYYTQQKRNNELADRLHAG